MENTSNAEDIGKTQSVRKLNDTTITDISKTQLSIPAKESPAASLPKASISTGTASEISAVINKVIGKQLSSVSETQVSTISPRNTTATFMPNMVATSVASSKPATIKLASPTPVVPINEGITELERIRKALKTSPPPPSPTSSAPPALLPSAPPQQLTPLVASPPPPSPTPSAPPALLPSAPPQQLLLVTSPPPPPPPVVPQTPPQLASSPSSTPAVVVAKLQKKPSRKVFQKEPSDLSKPVVHPISPTQPTGSFEKDVPESRKLTDKTPKTINQTMDTTLNVVSVEYLKRDVSLSLQKTNNKPLLTNTSSTNVPDTKTPPLSVFKLCEYSSTGESSSCSEESITTPPSDAEPTPGNVKVIGDALKTRQEENKTEGNQTGGTFGCDHNPTTIQSELEALNNAYSEESLNDVGNSHVVPSGHKERGTIEENDHYYYAPNELASDSQGNYNDSIISSSSSDETVSTSNNNHQESGKIGTGYGEILEGLNHNNSGYYADDQSYLERERENTTPTTTPNPRDSLHQHHYENLDKSSEESFCAVSPQMFGNNENNNNKNNNANTNNSPNTNSSNNNNNRIVHNNDRFQETGPRASSELFFAAPVNLESLRFKTPQHSGGAVASSQRAKTRKHALISGNIKKSGGTTTSSNKDFVAAFAPGPIGKKQTLTSSNEFKDSGGDGRPASTSTSIHGRSISTMPGNPSPQTPQMKVVRFSGDVPNNSDVSSSLANSKLGLRRPTGLFIVLLNVVEPNKFRILARTLKTRI